MADEQRHLTSITVELLSAFVSNNPVRTEDLAGLIQSTHAALSGLNAVQAPAAEPEVPPVVDYPPAVTVRKSLASPEHIVSMIDGKPYRSLKRHLSTHGLTSAEYKARYNLPDSYPSVAPAYSEARRETAKRLGLGRKPQAAPAEPTPEPEGEETPPAKPTRGRPRKAKAAWAPPHLDRRQRDLNQLLAIASVLCE